MHGGLGVDHSTLLPMTRSSDTFWLIFYDHRCNGRSRGASLTSLTWDNLALDAEALRERIGISEWAVLAYYHDHGLFMQIRALLNASKMRSRRDACIFGFQHLLKGWSIMDRLAEITVPTLLIAGRRDFQFPPEHQMVMAKSYPNAHYEIVEQASHNPLIERPMKTMKLIKQFMKL